ncbi:MAG: hypothetical protein N2506_05375 [Dehalococcoidales bacterium]|nr:hypothetical protein [Dehalococcoidales bacterium]
MRELSPALLEAQRSPSAIPYVRLEAVNRACGVLRCDWTRLYTGSEPDYYHAVTVPADGSLVRVRIGPPADSRKVYRQRVVAPGAGSNFSQWLYTGQYNAVVVTAASLGAEVSIFWVNTSREVKRIRSTDYGANFGSAETLDYTPTTSVYGIAAAYKPNGDLAVFFADQSTLYVKKCVGGQWQTKSAWNKSTGNLSGVGCIYDGDWNILVTGKDTSGNFKLWATVYGDGGAVPAGSWSALKEIASAPSGGSFEYLHPFLDKVDVYRCFFVEKFSGSEAYSRPFWSHTVAGSGFADGLWREPVPFNLTADYGLALTHDAAGVWLSSPSGVWQAPRQLRTLDLTSDIIRLKQEIHGDDGFLVVELGNDSGRYSSPGEGELAVLGIGCQLDFSFGYLTGGGAQTGGVTGYRLEAYEHVVLPSRSSIVLHAVDGWQALSAWRARHQFRWNRSAAETSVLGIMRFVLARVGLPLEVKSSSSVVTGFYPDFTISPGDSGKDVLGKLLSFVPDRLFIEGNTAYLVNPLPSDVAVYTYGDGHAIVEGYYRKAAQPLNRVLVEGYSSSPVLVNSFAWEGIIRGDERLLYIEDRNITSIAQAQQRALAFLRRAEIGAGGGSILVPVNCGQQLYDVIAVRHRRPGGEEERVRVLGILLGYDPARGEYRMRLSLGAV